MLGVTKPYRTTRGRVHARHEVGALASRRFPDCGMVPLSRHPEETFGGRGGRPTHAIWVLSVQVTLHYAQGLTHHTRARSRSADHKRDTISRKCTSTTTANPITSPQQFPQAPPPPPLTHSTRGETNPQQARLPGFRDGERSGPPHKSTHAQCIPKETNNQNASLSRPPIPSYQQHVP